jgi:hypothetical protein
MMSHQEHSFNILLQVFVLNKNRPQADTQDKMVYLPSEHSNRAGTLSMHSKANQHAACADQIFQVDCKLHVISEGTIVHINYLNWKSKYA